MKHFETISEEKRKENNKTAQKFRLSIAESTSLRLNALISRHLSTLPRALRRYQDHQHGSPLRLFLCSTFLR